MRISKKNFIFIFFSLALGVAAGCSIYQSDDSKAIEKNSGNLVTGAGVNFSLNTRYECASMMALPIDWQRNITSLQEFVSLEGGKAVLLADNETPTVVVYYWVDRHVEACTLTVMDSKLSSQNLSDVVGFGEALLTQSTHH